MDVALWWNLGATTVTSPNLDMMRASTWMPDALYPSSLQTSILRFGFFEKEIFIEVGLILQRYQNLLIFV